MPRLEAVVRRVVDSPASAYHCPGVVVAVWRGGKAAESVSAGCDGAGVAVDERSVFPICSATKLATSLSVLRLVDQGRVELDGELSRYLPDAVAAGPGVTIRRLLSHTSGLPLDVSP